METWVFLAVTALGALATLALKHRRVWVRTTPVALGLFCVALVIAIGIDVGLLIARVSPPAGRSLSGILTYVEYGLSGLIWAVMVLDWMTKDET